MIVIITFIWTRHEGIDNMKSKADLINLINTLKY